MLRYLAFLALLAITPAAAQDSNFPTPGNARVPGFVTMCIVANQAVPCAAGGSLVPGTTAFVCGSAGSFAYSDGTLLQCDANLKVTTPSTSVGNVSILGGGASVPQFTLVPNSGNSFSWGMANTGGMLMGFANTLQALGIASNGLTIPLNSFYGFGTGAAVNGALSALLSSAAAGIISVDTTAANNGLGTLRAALIAPGLLYSAAGTPLPACAAGTNGYTAVVSDNTAPTYRSAYTSGGAVVTRMICVSGTGWLSD